MTLRPLLLSTVALLSCAAAVRAADMDALLAAPEVSIAASPAGWYVRGDLSYDWRTDLDGARAVPGGPAFPFAGGELDEAFGVGVGIGYQFTDMLRADVTGRYSEGDVATGAAFPFVCGAPCFGRDGAEASSWEVMANGYVDLGTFAGVTPYVGGGLGAVELRYDDAVFSLCATGVCSDASVSGGSDWRFAYALTAGVAYDLSEALSLDAGYRYLDAEDGEVYRIGASAGAPGGVFAQDDGFDRHTIRIGLRYKLR